nr:hypothetical protein [Propionibacterium sp.]
MPETRTFDPEAPDPVAAAIRAALGDPVRPNQPGAPAAPRDRAGADASASGPAGRPVASLGSFTFVAVPPPPPTTAADPADDAG